MIQMLFGVLVQLQDFVDEGRDFVALNTVEFGRLGKVSVFVLSTNPETGDFTGRAAVVARQPHCASCF